jgi:hypothetical protein
MYTTPDTATAALDDDSRRAVTHISYSAQAVQVLQLHADADKPAVLAAFAATAHHNQRNVLAVPATDEAMADLTAARYADAATRPDTAQHNLKTGRWKLPLGSLVVVDDADQLPPKQLRYLTDHAEATNTKLLLLTNPQPGHQPAHSLIAALTENLPWTQQLGTRAPAQQRASTALQRAAHHLATTAGTADDLQRAEAAQLLARRDQLVTRYRDLTRDIAEDHHPSRTRSRDRSRDYGLEL